MSQTRNPVVIDHVREGGVGVEFAVEIAPRRQQPIAELLLKPDGIGALEIMVAFTHFLRGLAAGIRVGAIGVVRHAVNDLLKTAQELMRGEPHDPRLPAASVDLALLVHMYHEVAQPYGLLWNLRPALRPGGRVAVIDARKVTAQHGTPPDLLRCELAAVGYRQTAFYNLQENTYLAVFMPPSPPDGPVSPSAIKPCSPSRS